MTIIRRNRTMILDNQNQPKYQASTILHTIHGKQKIEGYLHSTHWQPSYSQKYEKSENLHSEKGTMGEFKWMEQLSTSKTFKPVIP